MPSLISRVELDEGGVHGPGGDKDFGDKDFVVLEQLAELFHSGDQAFVQNTAGGQTPGDRPVDESLDVGLPAADQRLLHGLKHESLLADPPRPGPRTVPPNPPSRPDPLPAARQTAFMPGEETRKSPRIYQDEYPKSNKPGNRPENRRPAASEVLKHGFFPGVPV